MASKDNPAKDRWLAELFDRSGRDLLRFLASRLPNSHDAEDLAQEVYLRLLRVDDVGVIRDPRSFALRVASNVAHEHRMLLRNRLEHSPEALEGQPAEDPGPYDRAWQAQEMRRLGEVLRTLNPTCRAIVLMHRRDHMTYQEIADFFGLSVGMVKKHLSFGLAACRDFLQRTRRASRPGEGRP